MVLEKPSSSVSGETSTPQMGCGSRNFRVSVSFSLVYSRREGGTPTHMDRENDPRKSHSWKREKTSKIQLLQEQNEPTSPSIHPHTQLRFFLLFFPVKKEFFFLKKQSIRPRYGHGVSCAFKRTNLLQMIRRGVDPTFLTGEKSLGP